MRDIIMNPNYEELGGIDIMDIEIDRKSRDDIPKTLLGLQSLYGDQELRTRLFALLENEVLLRVDLSVGRPCMSLWASLVMAMLKQKLGCDFHRLDDLVRNHVVLRLMLGYNQFVKPPYSLQQVIDNVSLFSVEELGQVSMLMAEAVHRRTESQVKR